MAADVRTRFAPSPSGHLHVGGARTALYCWAYARGRGGRFILRIEDTDQKRSSDASAMAFLDDLTWLGLDWDEGPEHEGRGGGDYGPYRQSERLDVYRAAIETLLAAGHAYRAFETSEELDAARRQARAEKKNYRYDRAALDLDADTVDHYCAEGRPHVIRFKMPDREAIRVPDVVIGDVEVAAEELDDFVIAKADGYPTYHFAVVVDDAAMGVTHVIRGQEHLYNSAKHIVLQDALGYPHPTYAHLSLIFNPDGSKMSKRDKDKTLRQTVRARNLTEAASVDKDTWTWWLEAKDRQLDLDAAEALAQELAVALPEIHVDEFRCAGYLPEVLVNYLALLGWSPGDDVEKFDLAFLAERFDLDRVGKSPAKFDRDKLLAFNLDALQSMDGDAFTIRLHEHATRYAPAFIERFAGESFGLFAAANQARSKTLADPFRDGQFFIIDDDKVTYAETKAVRKALVNGDPNGYTHLELLRTSLADLDDWSPAAIDRFLADYANTHADGKLGKIAQPLRIAVTGSTVSPAIDVTLALLGKTSVVNRIDRCLAARATISGAST